MLPTFFFNPPPRADLTLHNRSDCSDGELASVFRRDAPFLARTWRPFTGRTTHGGRWTTDTSEEVEQDEEEEEMEEGAPTTPLKPFSAGEEVEELELEEEEEGGEGGSGFGVQQQHGGGKVTMRTMGPPPSSPSPVRSTKPLGGISGMHHHAFTYQTSFTKKRSRLASDLSIR